MLLAAAGTPGRVLFVQRSGPEDKLLLGSGLNYLRKLQNHVSENESYLTV